MFEGSTTAYSEEALSFHCGGQRLWGIVTLPDGAGTPVADVGAVIVVGGPQYRVGSHRQFVLLARELARHGYPALRFDYRGMGDAEGKLRGFEQIEPDLRAAIDTLLCAVPGLRRCVVWGLCDAASAALMFATADARVHGIVAANPWARSEASLAATHVKHYYSARVLQREFWAKLLRGRVQVLGSIGGLVRSMLRMHRRTDADATGMPYQARMAEGLRRFRGQVLLILSGNDLTAKEFLEYAGSHAEWARLLSDTKVHRVDLPAADHTFSSTPWRRQVEDATVAWLRALPT